MVSCWLCWALQTMLPVDFTWQQINDVCGNPLKASCVMQGYVSLQPLLDRVNYYLGRRMGPGERPRSRCSLR